MRKLLFVLIVFCVIFCDDIKVILIEKYGGKRYVIVEKE